MKPSNPLLQKTALDETFVMWNDPAYAEHQHHSDPGYTTQNGKDYAGRNTTEPEDGALQDGIPADLLSIELDKTGKTADNDDDFYRELEQEGQQDRELHEQAQPAEYDEALNRALTALDVLAQIPSSQDIQGCAQMTAADLRQFAEEYKAGKARRFSSADNPSITTMPSAPAPVDPSDATFFKESDPMPNEFSPAEEKVNAAAAGSGFHYGARVTDGTSLWFKGRDERLSFDPKTRIITHLKNGKVVSEVPLNQLSKIKSSAEEFHTALKKELGQDKEAAIRPSPHTVFETKVDNATGKEPIAPTEPSDDEVMKAQKTLENAGVGDQIGVNASSEALPEGWHVYDPKTGEEAKTAANPNMTVQKWRRRNPRPPRPESEQRPIDPFIDWFVNEVREGRTYDSNLEEARKAYENLPTKDAAVTKTYGTGTPPGGTPNDPSVDIEDDDEADKTSSTKVALVGIHETPKHLPPRDDIRRHIDQDVQDEITDEVMEGVKDDKIAASDEDANEYYLDQVHDMKAEAKEAFMMDPAMMQEAQDAGMSMDELWKEVGADFTENYYMSAYSKQGSIEVYEGLKCPNCKSTKGKPVEDGTSSGVSLRECLTCGSFY
jgi:hypothetical protein